jgi:3-oxoacyl-[acyl-carrier-protein] synthase-1
MNPLTIISYTTTTSLGEGNQENWNKLLEEQSGLSPCHFSGIVDLPTWVGEVAGVDEVELPAELAAFDCRNNRLAWLGLQQDSFQEQVAAAVDRYGADRVAVFMGTSTSGIHQTELAYREMIELQLDNDQLPDWYDYKGTHNPYSLAEFTRRALALEGLASSISTACSSSAKVFASAYRAIEAGYCDAAVVGGVDSLCLTTLYGFNSLQLVANDICRPADINRNGLSIGEAAGFALLEKSSSPSGLCLLGYGESSDAYHMSSPHPDGDGAVIAMQAALNSAAVKSSDVDYINLHGTGTPSNDISESNAVYRVFGDQVPCSSTKGWTGHTLGAAGIVEAIFSALCMANNFVPCSLNTQRVDPAIKANIAMKNTTQTVNKVVSNSFGFGGTNCSLLLGCIDSEEGQ